MSSEPTFAAVEAGGTTFKVAISKGSPTNIVERTDFPTTTPDETLSAVKSWLSARQFDSLGVASFGPIDPDTCSSTYGYITTTPKPNWGNTNVLGAFDSFKCPKKFDTDVNGPALSELKYGGHGESVKCCAYITIGTGIGVGVAVDGSPVHGLLHPEAGHIPVFRAPGDELFPGTCPFHGNACVEGNASSGAIATRLGLDSVSKLGELSDDHPVWEIVAHYIAQLCVSLVLIVSPQVIVIGGGVMKRACLFPLIRQKTLKLLNGYIKVPKITERIDTYIVPSVHGDNAGLVGALELSRLALQESSSQRE